jgi:hypothetical protein
LTTDSGKTRTRVNLLIEFFDARVAQIFVRTLQDGAVQISPLEYQVCVHVLDPKLFCTQVQFKYASAHLQWAAKRMQETGQAIAITPAADDADDDEDEAAEVEL